VNISRREKTLQAEVVEKCMFCTSFLAYTIPTFRYRICGCHSGVDEGSRDIVRDIV